jgi:transposase-like protein
LARKSGFSLRELRGLGIVALGGQIKRESDGIFLVRSQSNSSAYHRVEWRDSEWVCDCLDYLKRKKPCKHIYAVNFLLDLPKIVLANLNVFERQCPFCGSLDVRPKGFRYNKSGPVRLFRCRKCGKRFKDETVAENCNARTALAVIATDLYYKGLSLRDISDHLWQIYGVKKPVSTIHYWVSKITDTLKRAFEETKLEVGDKWLADETIVKIGGEPMYLWSIIDYETRCYIASLLASKRDTEEAVKIIKEAIKNAGKVPKILVTDGLKSYAKAMELLGLPVNHISNAGLTKYENNNRIERLHGTLKDWIKRRRGVKDDFKDFLEGYRIYYNYLRPNSALDQKTPAGGTGEKWVSVLMPKGRKNEREEECFIGVK